jgi:glycopeptide antibiotics resistance protein
VTAWRVRKKPSLGLLIGYTFLILAETVLIRKPFAGEHLKLELFWSWRAWIVQRGQIIANVIMFIPAGVLTGCLWNGKGILTATGLSVGIEILQLVTNRGLCEFDDVFHNVIGAVIGVGIVMLVNRQYRMLKRKD